MGASPFIMLKLIKSGLGKKYYFIDENNLFCIKSRNLDL